VNCEGLPTHSREEFCAALKAARERKGITLAEITKTTNIPSSLFAGLEHGNLRYWPGGLFRRSFFRDYARAIGLPAAESCAAFVLLFPDEASADRGHTPGDASPKPPAPSPDWASELRLELDAAWHGPRSSIRSRVLTGAVDAAAVILVAIALAWVADEDRPATIATVALTYFCLATPLFGGSPAQWLIGRRRSIREALAKGPAAVIAVWRRSTAAISRVVDGAEGGTNEPADGPETRPWISDARRVGPEPRLRVRFKLSR
jgi:transcriptional regulator with XRE-family HTH domain